MSLWFFWGNNHLTFLRWVTLESACHFHDNVVLVRRRPVSKLTVQWQERQDFHYDACGRNWMNELPSKVTVLWLEDIAPEIAKLQAPDIQTSDMLAWWALAKHGGTVADMDIVFTHRLPPITHPIHMVICTGYPLAGYTPIGFLQGQPCDFWDHMYRQALLRYDPYVYQSCGAMLFPPWDQIPEPKALLPECIVYPWALQASWDLWHDWMFERDNWPPIPVGCCGIHWYGGKNQNYNQAMTNESVMTMRGAIPDAIRRLLVGRLPMVAAT